MRLEDDRLSSWGLGNFSALPRLVNVEQPPAFGFEAGGCYPLTFPASSFWVWDEKSFTKAGVWKGIDIWQRYWTIDKRQRLQFQIARNASMQRSMNMWRNVSISCSTWWSSSNKRHRHKFVSRWATCGVTVSPTWDIECFNGILNAKFPSCKSVS